MTVKLQQLKHGAILLTILASGCVIKPSGSADELVRLEREAARQGYETDRTRRTVLPELPENPTWRDILRRAFYANGDLEARFHEWAMAVQRIDQAGSWPSQNLELGFEYMFSGEQMKAFDRTTVSANLMDASALPSKTYESAKIAWRDAQAAGERFRAAKFSLQAQVLQAWADYALQAERVRIQVENVQLLRLVSSTAASRVRTGAAQQEQLRADVTLKLAENELTTFRSELDQQRAALNALLLRPPEMPLEPPATLPEPRRLVADDDALLAAGVENNAELSALGFDESGRRSAIERARQEYLPEINPMAAFTGSVSQSIGAAIVLPTQLPKIRAMVAESRADLRRVQAALSQSRSDRASQFAVAVLAMRDAERRAQLFRLDVIPLATRTAELSRQGYSSGTVIYLDLIDAQRTLLETRLLLAEAITAREKRLAEIESLAGVDVETIGAREATTQSTGTP
jgi:outer membrane protein TolC